MVHVLYMASPNSTLIPYGLLITDEGSLEDPSAFRV